MIMVFFISVAGLALRRHFGQPYVKPMIVAVGLILSITVFKNRKVFTMLVNGWGALGSIMLIAMVIMIPFGLARGLGLKPSRAFWISYAIAYAIAWANYAQFFDGMAHRGLGLINTVLFILFLVSLWGSLRFRFQKKGGLEADTQSVNEVNSLSFGNEKAEYNFNPNKSEDRAISKKLLPAVRNEFQSIEQLARTLRNIEEIVRDHGRALTNDDRRQIADQLQNALGQEHLFMQSLVLVKQHIGKMQILDAREFNRLKVRAQNTQGPKRKVLLMELARNKEKMYLDEAIKKSDSQLAQRMAAFDRDLKSVIQGLQVNTNPYMILANIQRANSFLKNMQDDVLHLKAIENRLLRVVHEEQQLIKVEERAA
jgi:hypothetical protein